MEMPGQCYHTGCTVCLHAIRGVAAWMILKKSLYKKIEWFDICMLLPLISRLNLDIAHLCSDARGTLRYLFDLDWRSSCLGQPFVRDKTRAVAARKFKHSHGPDVVKTRFKTQAREELEAFFIINDRPTWPVTHDLVPKCWFNQIPGDRGIVLLSAHLDSSWAGMGFISSISGRPVNAVYDRVVYHPMVFSFFQHFFRKKYDGIIRRFNGGTLLTPEELKKTGKKKLSDGEIIIFFADVPRRNGFKIRFMNEDIHVPYGGPSYALRSDSYMAVYVTRYISPGNYMTMLSPPVHIKEKVDLNPAVQQLYTHMERYIYTNPGAWWAADTLLDFCSAA